MPGGQIERDEKVSLELTDEIVRSMEVGSVFRDYNCKISSMDFHKASNHLVTASDDESIRLYDAANAMCLKTINSKKYRGGPSLLHVSSYNSHILFKKWLGWFMLLTTTAGHIYVLDSCLFFLQLSWLLDWFLKNISCQHVALLFLSQINSFNVKAVSSEATLDASFSPDGLYIVSGSGDGSVTAWNIRSGKEICSWVSTEFDPPVIKWSPGSLAFASGSTELSLWVPDLAKIESFAGVGKSNKDVKLSC